MDFNFKNIFEKVLEGKRINEDDALYLYEKTDLIELGQLADLVNRRRNSDITFFNVNRHINPTNVCAKSCKFCAFSRKPGEEGAYEYSIEEILGKARDVVSQGATEVHMVGGLHPRWRFSHILDILTALKTNFPQLHIKALTAVEIDWLAAKARLSIKDTLQQLKNAGLDSMPGGGAEIFHPEIRSKICDTKTDADRWIEIHRTAHNLGLRSNCTMLYGHVENYAHRVDHMRRLRDLQDETEGFNVFIPLAFQPQDNDMGIHRYTSGQDDLRNIAVARIYLDNFRHIKAYWVMLGQDIAQIALNFGGNDLDGTVTEEKISKMAGGRSGMTMGRTQIQNLIRKSGKIPLERDTLYNPIMKDKAPNTETKPTLDERQSARLDQILYKAEAGERLDLDSYSILAEHANLLDLSHCARSIANDRHIDPSVNFEDPLYKINCTAMDHQSGNEIVDIISREIANVGSENVVLSGLSALWKTASRDGEPLEILLKALANVGLRTISSASDESEQGLTLSEIEAFHRTCHKYGIRTVAKLELNASYSGADNAYWRPFLQRAMLFANIAQDNPNLFAAVTVEGAPNSMLTPVEYLRAIALARIVIRDVGSIVAPFKKIPTLRPRPTEKSTAMNDPAFKVLPLLSYFGATNFGAIREEECALGDLREEMGVYLA